MARRFLNVKTQEQIDAEKKAALKTGPKSAVDKELEAAKAKLANKKQYEALFPDPFMNKKQINYGGFILYLAGIMYMFQGISLVTQNYINPAIDTIKKKGIVSINILNLKSNSIYL